jgi:sulfite exporter TauE/SafE
LAGALVGACSGLMQGLFDPQRAMLLARIAAGTVLILVGVGILFKWHPLAGVESLGGRLWRRVAPLARAIPAGGLGGSVLLGLLWGWLPCGFVYSMLMFAALRGGAFQSAVLMLCFGLGTAPALFGLGMVSAQGARLGWARGLNTAAGWLLLVFGAMTIVTPWHPAVP